MDVYLSTVSNRLNSVMKQLTIIATIFLRWPGSPASSARTSAWMVRHIGGWGRSSCSASAPSSSSSRPPRLLQAPRLVLSDVPWPRRGGARIGPAKNKGGLARLRVRGLDRVVLRADLCILARLPRHARAVPLAVFICWKPMSSPAIKSLGVNAHLSRAGPPNH